MRFFRRGLLFSVLIFTLMFSTLCAQADGVLPRMPEPPSTPVYWQLARIEQLPEISAQGAYAVHDSLAGLVLDLNDGLLTASQLEAEDAEQGISLAIDRHGQTVMEHRYRWTPMPIYLEPGVEYTIDVSGEAAIGGATPNSMLRVYSQGDEIARISAGGYTGHPDSARFTLNANSIGIYTDGSFVVSFILRDVNDMFRNRIVFTYEMHDGAKPVPTPVPGFVATELDRAVPDFYVSVEGREDLWRIVTAPEQYRAFGVMTGVGPNFFPADSEGRVVMNEIPVEPQTDFANFVAGFVPETPQSVPAQYAQTADGVYSLTTRDGETLTRAYGRVDGGPAAFYPADASGQVADDAAPVEPEADYEENVAGFGTAVPESMPAHYTVLGEGLYGFAGRDGETRYRVYGRLDGAAPAFYPAEGTGAIAPHADKAAPVQPDEDFAQYIKGFDATEAPSVPAYYSRVADGLYAVEDRQGGTVYRAYGVKDGAEPAYYPADAQGQVAEDAQPVRPEDDFEAYIAGFVVVPEVEVPFWYEPTEVTGVWRFTDKEGGDQHRTHGELNRGESAFYPSDAEGNVAPDALPVQPASDLTLMPPPVFAPTAPASVPAHYQVVDGSENVYAFTDLAGEKLYRAYGAFGRNAPMYYPSDVEGVVSPEATPVDPDAEYQSRFSGFVAQTPKDIPAHYEVLENGAYRFAMLDGGSVYRTYGAVGEGEDAFYPADAQGRVISGEPVDPAAEYSEHFAGFAAQEAQTPPPYYEAVEGKEGLYRFIDLEGREAFRIYGGGENQPPAFYPADAAGNVVSGAAVDTQGEYESAYSSFSPQPGSTAIPATYAPVEGQEGLYTFTDRQGRTQFRIFGSASAEGEGSFYPADAQGNVISGVPADPQADALQAAVAASYQIATPKAADATATPHTRTMQDGTHWATPTAAPFVASINPTEEATQTAPSLARLITAAPDATASPLPAELLSAITRHPDAVEETPQTVTQWIEGATEAPQVASATQQPGDGTEPAQTVQRVESNVTDNPADAASAEPEETEATPSPEQTLLATPAPTEPKETVSYTRWIILAAGVIAVIAGGWWFIAGRKKKDRP